MKTDIKNTDWNDVRALVGTADPDDIVILLHLLVDRAVLLYECDHCGALPIEPCRVLPGQIAQITHYERVEACTRR